MKRNKAEVFNPELEKETHVVQLENGNNITLEEVEEGVFKIGSASTFRQVCKDLGGNEEELVGLVLKRKNLEKTEPLDEHGGVFAGIDDDLPENSRRWNEIKWEDGKDVAKIITSTMGLPASKREGNLGTIEASSLDVAKKALNDVEVGAYSINDM